MPIRLNRLNSDRLSQKLHDFLTLSKLPETLKKQSTWLLRGTIELHCTISKIIMKKFIKQFLLNYNISIFLQIYFQGSITQFTVVVSNKI